MSIAHDQSHSSDHAQQCAGFEFGDHGCYHPASGRDINAGVFRDMGRNSLRGVRVSCCAL
jgi:hypothetical protein